MGMILKTVKKCPECGSMDIMPDWALKGTSYHCKKCGWRGAFVVEEAAENTEN